MFRSFVTLPLVFSLLITPTFACVAKAEVISVEALLAEQSRPADARAGVELFLVRQDVQDIISANGVPLDEVRARLAALSDAEVEELAKIIADAPAGGDGVGAVVGGILIVFFVLLFTDILGLTKVFPFTRSVARR